MVVISRISTRPAEMTCAISVAQATPATPIWTLMTNTRSSTMLTTLDTIKK